MAGNKLRGKAVRSSARSTRRRRLGLLNALMSPQDLAALTEAVETPLSPADQATLEGKHTDALGISLIETRKRLGA
jgi:hypothetical protein